MRAVRRVTGLLAALGVASTFGARPALAEEPNVALVVVIVVDQLGRTYFDRYRPLLTEGFGPLARGAAVYPSGTYAYANTETAPGHTTLATGTWPSVHGITGNHWFDGESGAPHYCYGDPDVGRGPGLLRVPTLADALVLASNGQSRVVSVSLKDRAAIALGGHAPHLTTWYDKTEGRFIAGRWKGTKPAPAWFNRVALANLPVTAFEKTWDRLLPKLDYAAVAGPDDAAHEEMVEGFGRTFPRVMGAGLDGPTSLMWRRRFAMSPHALEATTTIALAALEHEKLGQRARTDMLMVSYSTLDYAGHKWGTNSQEALDVLLRIDREIGRLMAGVHRRVGEGKVLWVLTADHGATPTVEDSKRLGLRAERIDPNRLRAVMQGALDARSSKLRVVEIDTPRAFISPAADPEERTLAARAIAIALRAEPYIEEAFAAADLDRWPPPFGERFRRSHYPGRGGDVLFRISPLFYPADYNAAGKVENTGTGHGSPYNYDTEVPIIIRGPGVRPGWDPTPQSITKIAPTIAALIGIQAPAAALAEPLPSVAR